jgi:hypothetical protein
MMGNREFVHRRKRTSPRRCPLVEDSTGTHGVTWWVVASVGKMVGGTWSTLSGEHAVRTLTVGALAAWHTRSMLERLSGGVGPRDGLYWWPSTCHGL